jgi:hypothetical protein
MACNLPWLSPCFACRGPVFQGIRRQGFSAVLVFCFPGRGTATLRGYEMRRQVVAAAVFLFASAAAACADNITYNIVDYPVNEVDQVTPGGTDTISGTIITDGTLGSWSSSHVIGGTLRFVSPKGTAEAPLSSANAYSGYGAEPEMLYATSTQLLFRDGDYLTIWFASEDDPDVMWLQYTRLALGNLVDSFQGLADSAGSSIGFFQQDHPPAVSGSIGANDPWIIAIVPEPSTLVLLGIGAASLFACAWQRRRQAV